MLRCFSPVLSGGRHGEFDRSTFAQLQGNAAVNGAVMQIADPGDSKPVAVVIVMTGGRRLLAPPDVAARWLGQIPSPHSPAHTLAGAMMLGMPAPRV